MDLAEVKQWYNGYNFLGEPVYNPFDMLLYLRNRELLLCRPGLGGHFRGCDQSRMYQPVHPLRGTGLSVGI